MPDRELPREPPEIDRGLALDGEVPTFVARHGQRQSERRRRK